MSTTKRAFSKAWIAAAVLFTAFLASGSHLALFIHRYYEANPPQLFYVHPIYDRTFTHAGRSVEITDDPDAPGGPRVNIRYGEDRVSIPVSIPARFTAPDLHQHEDWLRLILWQEGTAFDPDAMRAARLARTGIPGNLVAVTRQLPAGEDPQTRGQLARYDWVFVFHEFLDEPDADGKLFRVSRQIYPESLRSYNRRKKAAAAEGLPPPPRRANELQESTWQYHVAMTVMPEGSAPHHRFNRNALVAAGWRWTLPALSLTGCVVAAAIAISPPRTTQANTAHRPK
ncbi:MAG: hypothetical protein KF866_11780 [Phycisphaeraceae bacterium]|nr:hypothetical protein [Phycisphaeraceae bacterium]